MGCSQSTGTTAESQLVMQKSPSKATPSSLSFHRESHARIIENNIIVWFLSDSITSLQDEQTKLRRSISTIKIFTDRDECMTYLLSIRIERIFLIAPPIETFLESVQHLTQIEKIYILHPSFYEIEKIINVKIPTNVFNDIDSLCQQLETDVELCSLDLLFITSTAPSSQNEIVSMDAKKQEAFFLYAQLLREMLYRLKFENNAKSEFVNFCRLNYADDVEQLRFIDEFEKNYRPQKALWWITRPCFVWRILQRMQRTFEIDILYKLGFLLKHVHTQLTIFHENTISLSERLSIVYRGKTMSNHQFLTLVKSNLGGLLSFGNYFTAYVNQEISINFIYRRLTTVSNDFVGILFEIHMIPAIHSIRGPYVTLDKVYVDENNGQQGIFFSTCTVFHIDAVEEYADTSTMKMWKVKLTLVFDDDPQLLRLVAPLRSGEVQANPLSYAGKLFIDMGEYKYVERFFAGMLQDASVRSQPRRLIRVLNGLGANYMAQGNYIKALEQYHQALDVSLSYLPPIHKDLIPLYDAIGKNYFFLSDYNKAIEHYEKAVSLIEINGKTSIDEFAGDLHMRIDDTKKLMNKK